jgi:sulfoxide reductase heme-binding subunit YedZ
MTLSKLANWTIKTACFMPLVYWIFGIFTDQLGVEPLVKINTQSGYVVLIFLLTNAALGSVHSLRLIRYDFYKFLFISRRFLGVFCGFYLILHFLTYLAKESFLLKAWTQIYTKNYLIAASLSAIIILVMTATSNDISVRWLKGNWKRLHRWIYIANFTVLFHIFLIEKANLILLGLLVLPVLILQMYRVAVLYFK